MMSGVQPLKSSKRITVTSRAARSIKKSPTLSSITPRFPLSDGYDDMRSSIQSEENVYYLADKNNLPANMLKKVEQGEYPLETKLDLHGDTLESARYKLCERLQKAYDAQQRCILIIHGKGRQAKMKNYVVHWLKQIPLVLFFCSAQPKDGGSGSLYVMIKRQKQEKAADLSALRKKIDVLDKQLVALLCQRLLLAKKAAQVKKTAVPDLTREEQILNTVRQQVIALGYPAERIEPIFKVLLEQTKQYQTV